jgi:small subunit ribosomal protein S9
VIDDENSDPASADSPQPAGENDAPVESADTEAIGSSAGAELPEQPAAPEPAAAEEAPAAEPVAEEEPAAAPEPVAEEEPAAAPEPVAEEPAAPSAPAPATPAPAPATPEIAATPEPSAGDAGAEEIELQPRVKPEIPGADLIPDIVPEGGEALHLDAEALAAAEAEAEEARGDDADREDEAKPIADAAIDLAAGARYRATGKRKTAVARVILKPGTGVYAVNGKTLEAFFPRPTLERVIRQPLETVGYEARMDVVAKLHGGGVSAQAGALRHGISRALIEADPNLRGELKRRGFLTRDPRVKERKKAGLKKARKRPQFSKR